MRAVKFAVLSALVALVLTSCTTFQASDLSYTTVKPQYTVLGDFHTEVWVNEFLGNSAGPKLFNLTADATDQAVKDAIQKEIQAKGGTAAINVKIVHQASFVDLLLNAVTWNIYAPGDLIITGTIVK